MDLANKKVNIVLKDGMVYTSVCVMEADDWAVTIRFQNVPHMIPRTEIKSLQVTGGC